MKIQKRIVIMVLVTVVIGLGLILSHRQWTHPTTHLESPLLDKNITMLGIAAQSYSRDHISHGQRLPPQISLQDLVNSGYVSESDIRVFKGISVSLFPIDVDAYPQAKLVQVRLSNGSEILVTADGSIQHNTR